MRHDQAPPPGVINLVTEPLTGNNDWIGALRLAGSKFILVAH